MKRSGKPNVKGNWEFVLDALVIFALFSLNQATDGQPESQLTVTGLANGSLVVTWSAPTIKQPSGDASPYSVDTYVLNYTVASTQGQSLTTSIRTTATTYSINNASLGATYQVTLTCVSGNVLANCAAQNVSAYPSCPKGLSQQRIQCYYLSLAKSTYPSLQQQCQTLLTNQSSAVTASVTDFSNMVAQDIQANGQSLIWMATDDCLYATADQVAAKNCCISLRPNDTTAQKQASTAKKLNQLNFAITSATCPAVTTAMAFLCGQDTPAITPKPENITFSAYANNSVRISWQERPQGWNLIWRTITVSDFNDQSLIQTKVAPNIQQTMLLDPLSANKTYAIQIWPHLDGTLMNNTAYGEFVLIPPRSSAETNGGAMRHPLAFDAATIYNGSMRVRWEVAQAFKENGLPFNADSYQLFYGLVTVNNSALTRVNLSDTSYVIPLVDPNTNYKFFLKCVFGTNIFICGRITSYTVVMPVKGRVDANKNYVVYELQKPAVPMRWSDAEKRCQRQDGHLLSVSSSDEETYLKMVMMPNTNYWIGANSCGASGNPTWTDGTPWNYTKLTMTSDQSSCCATIASVAGTVTLNATSCSVSNLFMCKYVLSDAGVVQNLTAVRVSSTAVNITWKLTNRLWLVSYFDVVICNLNTSAPCVSTPRVTSPNTLLANLLYMTSYRVEVTSYIKVVNDNFKSTVNITTGPSLSVSTNVSADGQVAVQWPDLGLNNQSNTVFLVQPSDPALASAAAQSNASYRVLTVNNKTVIQGLQLGAIYNFTLSVVDNRTGAVLDTILFTVNNRPNCGINEFQLGLVCYWVGSSGVAWADAEKSCLAKNGDMVLVSTPAEGVFLRQLAVNMSSPFWIDGQMSSLNQNQQQGMSISNGSQQETEESVRKTRDTTSQCRIVSNDNSASGTNGVIGAPCTSSYPSMCERRLAVKVEAPSNVLLKNLSSTAFILGWDTPKWKPSSYNITVQPSPPPPARSKRDVAVTTTVVPPSSSSISSSSSSSSSPPTTAMPTTTTTAPPSVTVMGNSVLVGGLKPATEYVVSIATVVTGPDAAAINGEPMSVRVNTLDPNSTAMPLQALELSAPPSPDENVTVHVVADGQLNTFRLISSITLVVLVIIALVIFVICRMFRFRDCLNHMFFAVALIIAHILIVLDANSSDQIDCRAVAICIHFFFMVAFLFYALECFCHVKTMTKLVPLGFLNRSWQHFLVGWGVPILIIIISAASVPDEYLIKNRKGHCWLNLEGGALLPTVIPIGIFAGLSVVFLALALCARPNDNYEVDEESYMRYEPMQDIRWMLLFILALLISHWSLGMIAVHTEDGNYFVGFIVLTIVLGISILLLRCIGDDEVRSRLRNCCQGTPIEPGENEIGRYLSNHGQGYVRKGNDGSDGYLIIKKNYIFRP